MPLAKLIFVVSIASFHRTYQLVISDHLATWYLCFVGKKCNVHLFPGKHLYTLIYAKRHG